MKSIVSNKRECYFCHNTYNLHRHHIFYGTGNRTISEKYGCWVYLCEAHHNMSDFGVHFNKELDTELKQLTQELWEEKNGSRQQFINTFGRSYL
ncbi:MAG: hypothetical protein E7279_11670 [Lachnospiraceae bacterium]|nr:hypothetical protein [Lachnospiraceae bacterium]